MVDFAVELITPPCKEKEEEGNWTLPVDGLSNLVDSGSRIILEGPCGLMLEESMKFDFKANNNQAKYEALLAKMRLALDVGTRNLRARCDSTIVTDKINGDCQPRDPQLLKY